MKIEKIIHKFSEVIIFIIAIVFMSMVIDASVISLADETADTSGDSSSEDKYGATYDCLKTLAPYLSEADTEFAEFLSDSVTSEVPSSEVVYIMMEKYKEYLANTEAAFAEATSPEGGQQLSDVTNKLNFCQDTIDTYIAANEQIMKASIISSSYAKKTTALLDEYKWINKQLRDMQETVGYIGGYLTTMNGQLSGFTKICVKQ